MLNATTPLCTLDFFVSKNDSRVKVIKRTMLGAKGKLLDGLQTLRLVNSSNFTIVIDGDDRIGPQKQVDILYHFERPGNFEMPIKILSGPEGNRASIRLELLSNGLNKILD